MTKRQEPAATTQTHSAADPGPPGPPRPSAPARQLAERTVPVTAPGARGPGTPQRPGTGSSEPRRCRPSPAAGLGTTAAPRAPRTPPPAGPRGTHRPGPRLPSRLPRCAAHGSAQTRRRPGTDEAGGGPAPRARRAVRTGGAGRGGTRAGARGRRGRAEERGRLPLPGRRVHKWRTRRGAANGRAPERHSLRESRRGPSRPARRPAGPGGTGSTGSAAPSSSSRLNAPAGRRVSARRKAHNFVPRAPRERKSRAAPAASAAPGPRGAYSGRTAARRSERPAAPHPPSVRPAPGALGKALPTGARLLSFASFSIAGGTQRTKAAPRSDKSGVPGATMKNSEEELQASREHE